MIKLNIGFYGGREVGFEGEGGGMGSELNL